MHRIGIMSLLGINPVNKFAAKCDGLSNVDLGLVGQMSPTVCR